MAVDIGLAVDMDGFNVSMEEARQKARSARYKVVFYLSLNIKQNIIHSLWSLMQSKYSSCLLLNNIVFN
jgi:hypothetical protein